MQPHRYRTVSFRLDRGERYRLVIDAQPFGYEKILLGRLRVPQNARLLMKLAAGGTLIDVGANIGTICIPCAMTGANVIAAEMLPDNCAKLAEAVRINGLTNVQLFEAAISNRNGSIGYCGEQDLARVSEAEDAPQAAALTIDSLVTRVRSDKLIDIRNPVVIKLDIEGYEWQALQGAEETIGGLRPFLLLESIATQSPDGPEKQAKRFLLERGYDLYLTHGNVLAPRRPDDLQEHFAPDFLAVPHERTSEAKRLLAGYAFRELKRYEQSLWLGRLALTPAPPVRAHALRVWAQVGKNGVIASRGAFIFRALYPLLYGSWRAFRLAISMFRSG